MEESVTILEAIKRDFACGEIDIRTYSPLALAYIGDAVPLWWNGETRRRISFIKRRSTM